MEFEVQILLSTEEKWWTEFSKPRWDLVQSFSISRIPGKMEIPRDGRILETIEVANWMVTQNINNKGGDRK